MKNVRSSQPCISMNFCIEFSKAQVLPREYRNVNTFDTTGCYFSPFQKNYAGNLILGFKTENFENNLKTFISSLIEF